jgi:pimeloyl-ACP methyl ester carboxylesterase
MADDAMVARYVEMARAPGHKDIILGLMSSFDPKDAATKEKLAAITAPTLVLHGTEDRLIPVSAAGKFGDAIWRLSFRARITSSAAAACPTGSGWCMFHMTLVSIRWPRSAAMESSCTP